MAEEVIEQPKIKTNFPGLHAANGVSADLLEVVGSDTGAGDDKQVAPAAGSSEPNPERSVAPAAQSEDIAPVAKTKISTKDLTDEEREDLIKELTGKTSAELNPAAAPTKEEQEAADRQRKANALAWAFENKKITKEEYDTAVAGKSKTDRELALQAFTKSLQSEDKNITSEEAEELFKDTFHEDADGRLKTIGENEIKKLADAYRKDNFSSVDGIDEDFNNFTQTQTQYKSYKTQVKGIAAEVAKEAVAAITYKDIDGAEASLSYKIPLEQKTIDKIVSDITSEKEFVMRNVSSDGKIDYKNIASEIRDKIIAKSHEAILAEALRQHGEEVEKRTVAILGNKRNPQQPLNDGKLNAPNAPVKQNAYTSLNAHMNKQRN